MVHWILFGYDPFRNGGPVAYRLSLRCRPAACRPAFLYMYILSIHRTDYPRFLHLPALLFYRHKRRPPLLFWTPGRSAEAAASNCSRRRPFSCIFYPVLSGMSRILHRMICFEEKEASCAHTSYFQKAAPWGQDSGEEGCSALETISRL